MVGRFAKVFAAVGFLFAAIVFIELLSEGSLGASTAVFLFLLPTIFIGSIGWMIDEMLLKRWKGPLVLIIIYALLFGGFLYLQSTIVMNAGR